MTISHRVKSPLITVGMAVLLLMPNASSQASAESSMQAQVDAVIDQFGGTQTAPNEVSWPDEGIVLDLAAPATPAQQSRDGRTVQTGSLASEAAAAASVCASGTYCAYSGTGQSGSKLSFSRCPSDQSLAALFGGAKSVTNARSDKVVKAYAQTTLIATIPANSSRNMTTGATRLSCS